MVSSQKEDLGFLFPIVRRILLLDNWWPPSKYVGKPRRSLDCYILLWWIFELACTALLIISSSFEWLLIIAVPLLTFRLFDICLVLLATLITSHQRSITEWASTNRTVFLVCMNAIEVFIIFAVYHYDLAVLFEVNDTKIVSFGDALYFSVVTGTTLGYGDISPLSAVSKLLASIQPLVLLFIVISVLAYARGAYEPESNKANPADAKKPSGRSAALCAKSKHLPLKGINQDDSYH
jgi:Ion channel